MRAQWLHKRVGVLAERNFRRFYTGFVTSLLGSSMSAVAIAWAVLDSRVSATGLGLMFTASVVPQVLLLPLAGAVADRLGRRRMMIGADALRCVAQATLAVALAAGRPTLWLFVLLAWLGGHGHRVLHPGPERADGRDRAAGPAGQRELAVRAGRIGYAVDGPLAAALGPATVFGAGAVYGLVSSAFVLALPSVRAVRWQDSSQDSWQDSRRDSWQDSRRDRKPGRG